MVVFIVINLKLSMWFTTLKIGVWSVIMGRGGARLSPLLFFPFGGGAIVSASIGF
jgi:hypothetical protein